MCGITGIIARARTNQAAALDRAERGLGMLRSIAHRGPDGSGEWSAPRDGIWLGHQRLAIIDPKGGVQPMLSPDESLVLVFNGCIYNYLEVASELRALGHAFETSSDTEVILHAYQEWGDRCVEHFIGMWAFALWDAKQKRLFCSRDRLGVKPFYYAFDGKELVFGSEIKAVLASGSVGRAADADALRQYLTFQFCLEDRTLFRGVHRLAPGHNLVLDAGGLRTWAYWDVRFDIDSGHDHDELVDTLRALLDDAVRLRLRSDVPLGAHLSGGLDSSVVVGTARKLLPDAELKTFTGAFEGQAYDERTWARAVAENAKAQRHEVLFTPADFADSIEKIIWHMDEPAAGPGVFPQYGVAKLAKDHVKVILGGQGGDEIFIGYARYLIAYLEECIKGAIEETAHQADYVATLTTIVPSLPSLKNYVPMLRRFWSEGLFEDGARRYFHLMNRFGDAQAWLSRDFAVDPEQTLAEFRRIFDAHGAASKINRIFYFDLKTHLQALLHVEDRTSMAWGLESRVPLLDYRLVELMASIKPTVKFKNGRLKHLFLEAVRDRVPDPVWRRKDKMGFPVPLAEWSKGPLRSFLHDILGSTKARQRGLFDTDALLASIDNEGAFGRTGWGALCLELWHRQFID